MFSSLRIYAMPVKGRGFNSHSVHFFTILLALGQYRRLFFCAFFLVLGGMGRDVEVLRVSFDDLGRRGVEGLHAWIWCEKYIPCFYNILRIDRTSTKYQNYLRSTYTVSLRRSSPSSLAPGPLKTIAISRVPRSCDNPSTELLCVHQPTIITARSSFPSATMQVAHVATRLAVEHQRRISSSCPRISGRPSLNGDALAIHDHQGKLTELLHLHRQHV
jgi:hypothetical protein